MPLIPNLLFPVRGPVHARLFGEALTRYLDHVDRNAEAAAAAEDAEAAEAEAWAPAGDKEVRKACTHRQ